jgi:hypothetical protein
MALYADRVKQSLGITGTGTVTLTLATTGTGYQSFLTAFGTGTQTVAYCIADQTGPNWEVGTGSYNGSANTLARTTVLSSSNGGSLTNFSGGTQDVFCTAPAKYLDTFTSANQGVVPASGGGTANFLRADGTFAAPPATAPAGSTTQIQYNNAGVFGATAGFSYDTSTSTFNIAPASTSVIIEPVAPTGSQTSTSISIRTKNASATNGAGGSIFVSTGAGLGTGSSGSLSVSTAASTNAAGPISFSTGNGTVSAGDMSFTCGNGTGANSNGGNFIAAAGNGKGTFDGGSFQMSAGGVVGAGFGGSFSLVAGTCLLGTGGDIFINSGGGATDGGVYIGTDSHIDCLTILQDVSNNSQMGFFSATPVAKPVVTGSRATGAALVSLLSKLAALGLITDSTTA